MTQRRQPHPENSGQVPFCLVHTRGDVVEVFDLPSACRFDTTLRPCEGIVGPFELEHRFRHPRVLMRRSQILPEQRDDGLDVAIEHGKAFNSVLHGKGHATVS